MTLEQMKIFAEAARCNSFTQAAENLGLTQSAVSTSVRKLEKEFGVTLFERLGRNVVVSDAGQVLLGESERILSDIDLTVRRVASFGKVNGPRLVIGCSHNAYDHWMPAILSGLGGRLQASHIDIVRGTSSNVAAWVMRGTADAGVSESMPSHNEFRYYSIFEDILALCGSRGYAERLSEPPSWRTLAAIAPLVWETGTDLESVVTTALERQELDPVRLVHPDVRLTTTAAVTSLALSGAHAAFVPLGAVSGLIAAGELVRLGALESAIPYWFFAPRHREIEPLAALLAEGAHRLGGRRTSQPAAPRHP